MCFGHLSVPLEKVTCKSERTFNFNFPVLSSVGSEMGCFSWCSTTDKGSKAAPHTTEALSVSANGGAKAHPCHNKAVMRDVLKEPPKDVLERVPSAEPIEGNLSELNIRAQIFSFEELAMATNNFRSGCLIGEGGFGCVYKGQLENGQVVAIKQLDRNGLQGNREFLVEVLMLSLLHHDNLVNLIGYCADGDQRLLVYEFMPLGSLEDHLHDLPPGKEPLSWITRMKIAAGAAKGLEYLHNKADPPVIYRDLKSSNILLGENYFPKLSDFGLAKLGPIGDKTHVSTRVMGTYGYCAPEYAMTGQLTLKSDVYSFGVVLLELITGRKAIDQSKRTGEHNLVAWARPLFKDRRKFGQMADPKLQGQFPVRGLFQALAVAAMCLHEQAASRPLIADVVTALNFLASQTCDPSPSINMPHSVISLPLEHAKAQPSETSRQLSADSGWSVDDCSEENGARVQCDLHDKQDNETPSNVSKSPTWRVQMDGKERARAIAEARIWGEACRERKAMSNMEKGQMKEVS